MQTAHSYRGLWVAGLFLAVLFVGISRAPNAEAAVEEITPIKVFSTTNNVAHTVEGPMGLGGAAIGAGKAGEVFRQIPLDELISWNDSRCHVSVANGSRPCTTGVFKNFIEVTYRAGEDQVLNTTARLYYTLDGSNPRKSGPFITMDTFPANSGPARALTYLGELTPATLVGATEIRFMIEVYAPGGSSQSAPTALACDIGRNATSQQARQIIQGKCPSQIGIGSGFRYHVDFSQPRVVANTWLPVERTTMANALTNVAPDAASSPVLINSTRTKDIASLAQEPIFFEITDPGSAGFSTPLDPATFRVTVGGQVRYVDGGATNKFIKTDVSGGAATRFKFQWKTIGPGEITPDQSLSIAVQAMDVAGNPIINSGKFGIFAKTLIADTIGPPVVFGNAAPVSGSQALFQNKVMNLTGLEGTLQVNVTTSERNLDRSATNVTAVRVWFWTNVVSGSASNADATSRAANACTITTRSKCLFASPLYSVPFKARWVTNTPGFVAATGTGLGYSAWETTVALANATGGLPNHGSGNIPAGGMNLNMTIFLRDVAGNWNATDATPSDMLAPAWNPERTVSRDNTHPIKANVVQVRPGAPVFEALKLPLPVQGFGRTGTYNLTVNITDPKGGEGVVVSAAWPKIKMTVTPDAFAAEPAGWTKLSARTYERNLTRVGTTKTFAATIPDAKDGAKISYEILAMDLIGNVNTTSTLFNTTSIFDVDKSPPSILEPTNRTWRGASPHTFAFAFLDKGAGINETSGKIFHRVKGAATYTQAVITAKGNLGNASISFTPTHGQTIEYYTEIMDRVRNLGNNSSASAPRSYKVDLVKPVTTLDQTPSNSDTGVFTLTTTNTDVDSKVDKIIFEGRSRSASGTFGSFVALANTTSISFGPTCLEPGVYEFRAFAIDKAGNAGNRSDARTTTVTGAGCSAQVTASISQPKAGSLVDGQGGSGRHEIRYTAGSTNTFTTAGLVRIKIEFSPDDGHHYHIITADAPNTGSYNWSVNEPTCDKCKLRLTAFAPGGKNITVESANFEVINGNPATDYDGNRVYDECELRYFGAIGRFGADDDVDGDGLKNQQECSLGTNPANPDTDGDGVSDGAETKLRHDPINPGDKPSVSDLRYQQWESYYALVAVLFVAVVAVFLMGLARRW